MSDVFCCVIGAGPGGLAAGVELRQAGVDFLILEQARGIGGIWDISRAETPIYHTTHFISSAAVSGFDGFAMPSHYPDYPRHGLVLQYLTEYADHFGVRPFVRSGVRVERATPRGDGQGFALETSSGPMSCEAVILAVGHNWKPVLPGWASQWRGELIHSLSYRSSELLRGRKVLIIGGGNSAFDIACDSAGVAHHTWLSLRRGYHLLPKHIGGVPTDQLESSRRRGAVDVHAVEKMLRTLYGPYSRYGLPTPDHRVFESNPVVNTQILHWITHGDVTPVPDVARVAGGTVHLTDGSIVEPDLIVCATGFSVTPPAPASPRVEDLCGLMISRTHRDLFVIGLFETDGAAFPLLSLQAKVVAALLRAGLSKDARRGLWDKIVGGPPPNLTPGRNYLQSQRHTISVVRDAYHAYLGDLLRTTLSA